MNFTTSAFQELRGQSDVRYLPVIQSGTISFIRRFVKGKQYCLIINPGYLFKELSKENSFRKSYYYKVGSGPVESFKEEVLSGIEDGIVLIDHTGQHMLSTKDIEAINNFKLNGISVYSVASFFEHLTGRIPLVSLSETWQMNSDLFFVPHREHLFKFKRVFDIIFSVFMLFPASILMAVGMLLVFLNSAGPLLFRQKRVGKNGKPFYIYKIRTMIHNPKGHKEYTTQNDNRIFPIGKFLRKTKIDELPQLVNVLFGEMSLIGPRPEKVDIVEDLAKQNPYYSLRHTILPGITGWAQVNNPRATPNENLEKLEFDLYYAKNMSYFLELRILWRTIKVLITLNSL